MLVRIPLGRKENLLAKIYAACLSGMHVHNSIIEPQLLLLSE